MPSLGFSTLRRVTQLPFGSGKRLGRLVNSQGSEKNLRRASIAEDVVAEGYLHILHVGQTVTSAAKASAWKRRYFVLHADGRLNYFKSGKAGVGKDPKGGALLSGDYFVADSLLRVHGFQVSDFGTTVYLACDSQDEQLEWMFKIGTVRRVSA